MNSRAPSAPGLAAGKVTLSGRSWSIRVSISSVVVVAMLMVASVILGLGWQGAREALLDTASRSAHDAGVLVNERARRLLEPSQSTLRQLSFDPIVQANSLEKRLDRLYVLSEELAANPLVSAIYVGYATGEFILARPLDKPAIRNLFGAPPKANFMVQSRSRNAKGVITGEYLFYNADAQLLERRVVKDYRFDPRTRGWYKAADASTDAVLSPPYVFFSTQQVGLTLSHLSRQGDAVVGIDVVLDELSAALGELRLSPRSQIALVNDQHEVLAYPDMQRIMERTDERFVFKSVGSIGEPSLAALDVANPPDHLVKVFKIDGAEVLGVALPFDVWPGQRMRLLVTAPVEELLGDMPAKRRHILFAVLALVLLMLPVGWLAGARIGRTLDRLTAQTQRMGRFDFGTEPAPATFVTEVNELNHVVQGMSHTIQSFLALSRQMASEPRVERMLDQVLHQMVAATRCEGGAVYLWEHETQRMVQSATEGACANHLLAEFTYPRHTAQRLDTPPELHHLQQVEFELKGRSGQLQGLLVLMHGGDAEHTDPAFLGFVEQLSGMLAISVETRQLIDAQKNLLDSVIRLMADAIDAKSPYTGGHCERVPELATALVDRMHADTTGAYADFRMGEDERYEFYLAAWLHDCGKVTSPEHIVDKATKLEVIHNRIHEIRTRFEVLWRDSEIAHLHRVASGSDRAASEAEMTESRRKLQADFAFVAQCNVGGEFMADESLARLKAIGAQTWIRHFDPSLGLSAEESRRLELATPNASALPATEFLLADRPEHLVAWGTRKPHVEKGDPLNVHGFDMVLPAHQQNMGELYNLSVRRGTLTDEDRFKINDHIVQTYSMLKQLPWPAQLAKVPDIAATHHEKMDGKGYPRKLSGSQLTVFDRVMALADIFEALTAADRPYKAPKTLTESLRIMAFMSKDQHIDGELFRYFLHSGIWRDFASRYMQPSQIDEVDVAAVDKLIPASP